MSPVLCLNPCSPGLALTAHGVSLALGLSGSVFLCVTNLEYSSLLLASCIFKALDSQYLELLRAELQSEGICTHLFWKSVVAYLLIMTLVFLALHLQTTCYLFF